MWKNNGIYDKILNKLSLEKYRERMYAMSEITMKDLMNGINNNYNKLIEQGLNLNIDSIYIENNNELNKIVYTSNDDSLHQLRSCSKLLISLAVGILIDRKIISLDENVYSILNKLVDIKNENIKKISDWTIKDLLLHQTGYEKQMMSERFIKDIKESDILKYALNYDIPYEVGNRFAYNNVEPFIISVYLKEKYNVDIIEFIEENIFKKLQINEFKWNKYDDKYCPGATGLYLKHNDFHKIGKILMNNGKYDGQVIVSEKWINEMMKKQIETPSAYKSERVLPKIGVGYYTFVSRDGYVFRDGADGQYIILNKEKDLLITIMSSEKEMSNVMEVFRNVI